MGPDAVERGAVLGAAGRADAAEPVGAGAQPVAVVVEQRVLGGQLRVRAIVLVDPAGWPVRNASRSETWPSLSRSALGSAIASARYWPNRAKFISCPLLVAVTMTRFAPESRLRNGPLAEVQSMTTTGRLIGLEPLRELDVGDVRARAG